MGKMIVGLILFVIIIELIIFIIQEIKLWRNKRIIKEYSQQNYKRYIPNNTPYHRVDLLTQNEYLFYQRLKTYVYPHGLQILAKIRLADLVNVNQELKRSEWSAAFSRISSKHVDFAIAKDMKVLIIIELDDSSHQRADRKQRDEFVNDVLVKTGYKIARTYGDILPVINALYDCGYDLERLKYPDYYK